MADVLEARKKGGARIRERLSDPADLERLEPYRRARMDELRLAEDRLKNHARDTLSALESATRLMDGGQDVLEDSLARMHAVRERRERGAQLIGDFELVRDVGFLRANLVRTADLLEAIVDVPRRIEALWDMLTDDTKMLRVYESVRALETLRDDALSMASSNSLLYTALTSRFRPVRAVRDMFEKRLIQMFRFVLRMAEQAPEILVQLAVILQLDEEEREKNYEDAGAVDETVRAVEAGAVDDETVRDLRSYKEQAVESIRESIDDRFKKLFRPPRRRLGGALSGLAGGGDRSGPEFSRTEFLANKEELAKDISCVYNRVRPSFPPSTALYPFYVVEYHKRLVRVLEEVARDEELSGGAVLSIAKFVHRIYTPRQRQRGALMPSPLLQTLLYPMIPVYVRDFEEQYQRYMTNLQEADAADVDDEARVNTDEPLYHTNSPTHLMRLLDQALAVVRHTGFTPLVAASVRPIIGFLEDWQDHSARKLGRMAADSARLAEIPIETVIAQVNNHHLAEERSFLLQLSLARALMECVAYDTDARVGEIEPIRSTERPKDEDVAATATAVAELHPRRATSQDVTVAVEQALCATPYGAWYVATRLRLHRVTLGFRRLAERAVEVLADQIFLDLQQPLAGALEAEWLDDGGAEVVVDTLTDYFDDDIHSHIPKHLEEALAFSCLQRVITRFEDKFQSGRLESTKVRRSCFDSDISLLHNLFDTLHPSCSHLIHERLLPLKKLLK